MLLCVGCNIPATWRPPTSSPVTLPTPMTLPTATSTFTPEPVPEPTASIEDLDGLDGAVPTSARSSIVISSKEYTQQLILGQMLLLMLDEAGYDVVDQTGLGGSRMVRSALENGEIDLYMELTGTALSVYHELSASALPPDPERTYLLAKDLDKSQGITWLDRGYSNNTYRLIVPQEIIDEGIVSIEDLANYMNQNDSPLTICIESEFYGRQQDGLFPMLKRYGFSFKEENILVMELDQLYEELRKGNCDISEGFATDGRISAWGFHYLKDTLDFFPFYSPAPVIRQEVLDQYPELEELLGRLGAHLNDETMIQLNARVDIGADGELGSGDEESVEMVARDFLRRSGLLANRPQIVVGSQKDTQQLLLGQMLVLMLAQEGYDVVDKTGLGEATTLRAALESGEIDLYWEYTGNALSLFHEMPAHSLPTNKYAAMAQASSLDKLHYDLVWLEPADFNYTFTLMMQQEIAEAEIDTLQALAKYMNQNNAPFTICVPTEFYGRETDGFFALEKHYQFSFKNENISVGTLSESYQGLRDGECEVAVGYNTDGRLDSWGFDNLADTNHFFPLEIAAPVIRQEVLTEHPTLKSFLSKVSPYLDNRTMSKLNARVDLGPDGELDSGDEESVKSVAKIFLCDHELLKDCFAKPVVAQKADAVAEAASAAAQAAAEAVEEEIQRQTSEDGAQELKADNEGSEGAAQDESAKDKESKSDAVCKELVVNGDFEANTGWSFSNTPLPGDYASEQVHQGKQALRLGTTMESKKDSFSSISQWVVLPEDAANATLTYWTYPISRDLIAGDIQGAVLYDESFMNTIQRLWWDTSNEKAWVLHNHDLSHLLGRGFFLYFLVINDGDEAPTAMFVDDVSLKVCYEEK